MPDFFIFLVILFSLIAIGALVLLFVDRCGREKAWREIATERRWP